MSNLREVADDLNVSYSLLYCLVNDNFKKRLEAEQNERKRLKREVSRLENELVQLKEDYVRLVKNKEKSDYNVKKWTIKAIYAEKRLKQLEEKCKKLEQENAEMLCQESKALARQVLKNRNLKLLP